MTSSDSSSSSSLGTSYDTLPTGVLDRQALNDYKAGRYAESLRKLNHLLSERRLDTENTRTRLEKNRRWALKHLEERHMQYPFDVVQQLTSGQLRNDDADVTVTITTCKRYELFTSTMNSFLNCCAADDLKQVARWVCVDDNSDERERVLMRTLYPFFDFVWKTPEQKGHARSMNLIVDSVQTPYWLHMEDDWLFLQPLDYVSRAKRVLDAERQHNVVQVLFNRNYAEMIDELHICSVGSFRRCLSYGTDGLTSLKYLLHEHHPPKSAGMQAFSLRHAHQQSHAYWPHYSLRPSLVCVDAIRNVGRFGESVNCFEFDFANRFTAAGFRSASLDSINCLHLGRMTIHRDDTRTPNAYNLNRTVQFYDSELKKNESVRTLSPPSTSPRVVLTVTTCKRVDLFLRSMHSLLSMLRDPTAISRFVCVDDNSSADDRAKMQATYPFFEFVWKTPEEKGHARSMNKILELTRDADYVLHTEDDWNFARPFAVADLIAMSRCGYGEVVLKLRRYYPTQTLADDEAFLGSAGKHRREKIVFGEYAHSPNDKNLPEHYLQWAKEPAANSGVRTSSDGQWWPGFTLNPSLWDRHALPDTFAFDESVPPLVFEFVAATALRDGGLRVAVYDRGVTHTGVEKSAYDLNGFPRY